MGDNFFRLNPQSIETFSPDKPYELRETIPITDVTVQYVRGTTDIISFHIAGIRENHKSIYLWFELDNPQHDNLPVVGRVSNIVSGGPWIVYVDSTKYVCVPRGACEVKY